MGGSWGMPSSSVFRAPYPLMRQAYSPYPLGGEQDPIGAMIGSALQTYQGAKNTQFEHNLQTEQEADRVARENADERSRDIAEAVSLRGAGLTTQAPTPQWGAGPTVQIPGAGPTGVTLPGGLQRPTVTTPGGTPLYSTTPTKAAVGRALLDLPAPKPGGTTATGGVAPTPMTLADKMALKAAPSGAGEPLVQVIRGGKRVWVPRGQAAGGEAPAPGKGAPPAGQLTPAQIAQAQRAFQTALNTEIASHRLPAGAPTEAVQAALLGAKRRAAASIERQMGLPAGSLTSTLVGSGGGAQPAGPVNPY